MSSTHQRFQTCLYCLFSFLGDSSRPLPSSTLEHVPFRLQLLQSRKSDSKKQQLEIGSLPSFLHRCVPGSCTVQCRSKSGKFCLRSWTTAATPSTLTQICSTLSWSSDNVVFPDASVWIDNHTLQLMDFVPALADHLDTAFF